MGKNITRKYKIGGMEIPKTVADQVALLKWFNVPITKIDCKCCITKDYGAFFIDDIGINIFKKNSEKCLFVSKLLINKDVFKNDPAQFITNFFDTKCSICDDVVCEINCNRCENFYCCNKCLNNIGKRYKTFHIYKCPMCNSGMMKNDKGMQALCDCTDCPAHLSFLHILSCDDDSCDCLLQAAQQFNEFAIGKIHKQQRKHSKHSKQ